MSASVLGFDLSRLPGGAGVAAVLCRALALGPDELPLLTGAQDDREARLVARATALDAAGRLVGTREALAAAAEGLGDGPRRSAALGLLDRASIGDVHALVRLVRDDVLQCTWRPRGVAAPPAVSDAVDVVVDAAVAAYTEGLVDASVSGLLSARWRAALPSLPLPMTDTGPCCHRVETLLGRVARLGERDLERLAVVTETVRLPRAAPVTAEWATLMHSATWAAFLAERLTAAATAQLRLVEAVHGAVPVEVLAQGCWSTLSGAVQAEVVGDLLDGETFEVLAGGILMSLGLPAR